MERIFVVTLEKYREETARHIPELPRENLIAEPEGKNTGPAIAIGMLKIEKLEPDAVAVVLPADHAIGEEDVFREVIVFGSELASTEPNGKNPLLTLGVKPRRPETGYGYIKAGEVIKTSNNCHANRVERFTEKPDLKTALSFLQEGGHYWNSGIFIWKISSILAAFERLLPSWYEYFPKLMEDMNTPSERAALLEFYKRIEAGPVDKLILEKWENTLVIPIDFPWSDLGSWQALDEFLRNDARDNIFKGEGVSVGSSSCLLVGEKRLIAVVGVKNLVVVDTHDAILVLDKNHAQDVKKIAEMLDKKGKDV
jgi:mannose-1-phosphate guanylyltransferase